MAAELFRRLGARCCAPVRCALALVLVTVASALAQEPDPFDASRARAVNELVGLAEEARRGRAYAAQHAALERVLVLDPEQEEARERLGYRRNRAGEWERKRYRAPRDWDEEEALRARERTGELLDEHRSRVLSALEGASEALVRDELVRLLELFPEDAQLLERLGPDVAPIPEEWVLEESRRTPGSRARLRRLLEEAYAGLAPLERTQAEGRERDLAIRWRGGVRGEGVSVFSSLSVMEAERTALAVGASRRFVSAVFGRELNLPAGMRVLLLGRPGNRDGLLSRHPEIDAEERALLRQLDGGWIAPGLLADWSSSSVKRTDGTVRQAVSSMLVTGFGLEPRSGWAWEGFGLYLTHALVGTRLTFFVQRTDYGADPDADQRSLSDLPEDWLREARLMLEGENPPSLSFLLGRELNDMRANDALLAHALAAYLLEGRPDSAAAILDGLGAERAPDELFVEVLGLSLPELAERLRAWLSEVAP